MPAKYTPEKFVEKFWSRVIRTDSGCWEWQGARVRQKHGTVLYNGKYAYVHRVVWEMANGPIPEGMCVLHHCDNAPCCNPDHLYIGTYKDNTRDMVSRMRGLVGAKNGQTKLSAEDVIAIRASTGTTYEVGAQFNISSATVSRIRNRVTWKHIT